MLHATSKFTLEEYLILLSLYTLNFRAKSLTIDLSIYVVVVLTAAIFLMFVDRRCYVEMFSHNILAWVGLIRFVPCTLIPGHLLHTERH